MRRGSERGAARKGSDTLRGGEGAAIFPLSIDGTTWVAIPHGHAAPQDAALAALAAGLERVRASTVAREGSWVLFYVRFFRWVMNTNLLIPVESGAIAAEVDGAAIRVSYRLRTVRFCVIVTAMALCGVVAVYSAERDLTHAAEIGLLVWLWLFGASYLITVLRFRWFVRGCVREGLTASIGTPRAATS